MEDVTSRAGLSGYLRDVERRVGERERANPIARASFHDGTRTRGAIGKYTHPDASEDYGAIFYDAAGNELLRVDDTSATLTTGSLVIADSTDSTKHTVFDTSALTTGVVRTITMPDADVTLGSGGGGGSGDMLAATYDPQTIADDAFDRANHTGTQVASTVSDFGTAVASNSVVTGNTSSIAANALTIFNLGSDVSAHHSRLAGIDAVQTTQNADIISLDSAVALNTAKVGITTAQANEITANTAKVSYPGGPTLATATIDTSNNLNDGTTARRTITASSLGTDWSIATNALTYSGTPSAVHIEVNVSYTSTGVRASPVVELWKGATKLAMAHTGYVRNNTGHNESSSNFTFIDTAPGTNPAYHVESSRGSTNTSAVTPLTPSQFAAYVFA